MDNFISKYTLSVNKIRSHEMYIRIILFPLSLSFATNYYHLQRDLSFEERSSFISINNIPRRSLTASPLNYNLNTQSIRIENLQNQQN